MTEASVAHSAQYAIEQFDKKHSKVTFACGVEALDHYLKTQARQELKIVAGRSIG